MRKKKQTRVKAIIISNNNFIQQVLQNEMDWSTVTLGDKLVLQEIGAVSVFVFIVIILNQGSQ